MLRKARILSGLRAEKLISASVLSFTEIAAKKRDQAFKHMQDRLIVITPCTCRHSRAMSCR
jgi:hypothetical protein